MNFSAVDSALARRADAMDAPAITLCVLKNGELIHEGAYGWLDPDERKRPVRIDTLFDMASITKLFTTAAFMTLVEEKLMDLDEPVSLRFPGFAGIRRVSEYEFPLEPSGWRRSWEGEAEVDADTITWRHVLTHTSGLGWMALYKRKDKRAALDELLSLNFAYPTGEKVVYTDIGLILLGVAMEELLGEPLDEIVRKRVAKPLGLGYTGYRKIGGGLSPDECAPTELCAWRGRRIIGEVHDENAAFLEGIAGHAGIFSTARDTARFMQSFLDALDGRPSILKRDTVLEMVREQAAFEGERRGIGFQLRADDPAAHTAALNRDTFGHTGFTGTCCWADPKRGLVIALNTNEVYNGRDNRKVMDVRREAIEGIVRVVS